MVTPPVARVLLVAVAAPYAAFRAFCFFFGGQIGGGCIFAAIGDGKAFAYQPEGRPAGSRRWAALSDAGIRVKADLRNEKVGFKIREHTLRRVPYMLVCGDKEIEAGKVAVRTRKGADLGTFTIAEFTELLKNQIRQRKLKLLGEE